MRNTPAMRTVSASKAYSRFVGLAVVYFTRIGCVCGVTKIYVIGFSKPGNPDSCRFEYRNNEVTWLIDKFPKISVRISPSRIAIFLRMTIENVRFKFILNRIDSHVNSQILQFIRNSVRIGLIVLHVLVAKFQYFFVFWLVFVIRNCP